jgi:glycosyltransferase involved in cell wall biosynthesis
MISNPLISVIVPVYNSEATLDKCVESIINQTYKNLEIFLVNDGSVDSSLSICQKIAATDSRIKVIDKKNGGVSSARNLGLDKSSGDFIAFVDSDDWISLNMYERMLSLMNQYNSELCICGRVRVVEGKIETYPQTNIQVFYDGCIDMRNLSCIYDLNISVNKLYPKKVFSGGLRFPENFSYGEDLYIVPEVLSMVKKIVYTAEGLYFYYNRLDSASYSLSDDKSNNRIDAYHHLFNYMKDKKQDLKIPFDFLFGSYVSAYRNSLDEKIHFKKKYNHFFIYNLIQCCKRFKCILFLVNPSLYFLLKKKV